MRVVWWNGCSTRTEVTPWRFSTRIEVRGYELDALGHVNHAVYHQYAEVARMKGFVAAGCDWDELHGAGPARCC